MCTVKLNSTAVAFLLALSARAVAAPDLSIKVLDSQNQNLAGVVVIANPATVPGKGPAPSSRAIMDQVNKEFVPETLVIRTGTQVVFPNSDSIAHQVYSFSPAKRFELPLYRGRPYPPMTFEQPGIVTLGCNIHDHMVGYIVVTDSPYFALTDESGRAVIRDLPTGLYKVSVWHPRARESLPERSVTVEANGIALEYKFDKSLRPKRGANPDRSIRDY